MPEPGTVAFDPDAAAAFTAAATQITALLDTAAAHAETAAGVDLSAALGLLGADFVAAFTTAVRTQGATVTLAREVVDGFIATIAAAGQALTSTDDDTAAALTGAAQEVSI